MTNRIFLSLLLTLYAGTTTAASDDAAEPLWNFGGFGTLGAGYHNRENVIYRRDLEQAGGIEGHKLGVRMDSRIGLQASASFTPRWSTTIQAVSRLSADGDWKPMLSWGFLRYAPTDWLELRAGRLGADIYLEGDSRHVGYAYTAVRPPAEVYGVVTQDRFDGADLTVRTPVAGGLGSLKMYGGQSRGDFYLYGQRVTQDDATTLGATLEWANDTLTLKAAWADIHARNDVSLLRLRDALTSIPLAQAQYRASQIETSHHITFAGVSARYESGPWSLQGILARESFSQFPRYTGWGSSVVAGYRIGAWKPYLTWGRISFEPDESALALPPPAAALQTVYDQVVDRLTMNQRSLGAGVRYDFATNYALKMQVEKVRASSSSILITPAGMPVRDTSLTLFSVVLDFVF
ncbi:signal protein [Methyloversatilis universalis]|uniref:signal protein n=1 Tax=Methyloversatilis universalis TaxID=378211 RepID=UPI001E4F8927|nr:signal protein [Methyloversatilis universalis]